MARESPTSAGPSGSGSSEAATTQARKEVRFAEHDDVVGEGGSRGETQKKRRTGRRLTEPVVILAEDQEVDPNLQPTCANFRREVTDRLPGIRYTETDETLQKDLEDRLASLADQYDQRAEGKGPGMPLKALVDGNDIHFDGVINAADFARLVAKHPDEMFKEVKLRAFLALAYAAQVKNLHHRAGTLDADLMNVHTWATAIGEHANDDVGAERTPNEREDELFGTVAEQANRINWRSR